MIFLFHFIVFVDDVLSLRDTYNSLTAFLGLGTLMSNVTNVDIEDSVVMNYSNIQIQICKYSNSKD